MSSKKASLTAAKELDAQLTLEIGSPNYEKGGNIGDDVLIDAKNLGFDTSTPLPSIKKQQREGGTGGRKTRKPIEELEREVMDMGETMNEQMLEIGDNGGGDR